MVGQRVDLRSRFGSEDGPKSMHKSIPKQIENDVRRVLTLIEINTQYDQKSMPKQVAENIMNII